MEAPFQRFWDFTVFVANSIHVQPLNMVTHPSANRGPSCRK